jgi:Zn-dependent alcohol dehydrogenase
MCAMNRLASSLASTSVRHGMRCHSFVSRSTTTQIESQPFDHGSPVTKSIEMSCQGRSGIGSSLNTANGACRLDLDR